MVSNIILRLPVANTPLFYAVKARGTIFVVNESFQIKDKNISRFISSNYPSVNLQQHGYRIQRGKIAQYSKLLM